LYCTVLSGTPPGTSEFSPVGALTDAMNKGAAVASISRVKAKKQRLFPFPSFFSVENTFSDIKEYHSHFYVLFERKRDIRFMKSTAIFQKLILRQDFNESSLLYLTFGKCIEKEEISCSAAMLEIRIL
jgi:hypothetical protein